ncbi:MAG: Hint domain-containing protein [Myxococcota bacterium]
MYGGDRLTLVLALSLGSACAANGDEEFSCVASGSLVRCPSGARPIEALRVGDSIYALDTANRTLVETRITVVRSAHRECVALHVDGDHALVCTPDHPLYDPETDEYAPASEWVEGRRSRLLRLDAEGARVAAIVTTRTHAGVFEVFDLTVESQHHNFIAADVLVHNKSYDECAVDPAPDYCRPDLTSGSDSDDTSGDGTGTAGGATSSGGYGSTSADDTSTVSSTGGESTTGGSESGRDRGGTDTGEDGGSGSGSGSESGGSESGGAR